MPWFKKSPYETRGTINAVDLKRYLINTGSILFLHAKISRVSFIYHMLQHAKLNGGHQTSTYILHQPWPPRPAAVNRIRSPHLQHGTKINQTTASSTVCILSSSPPAAAAFKCFYPALISAIKNNHHEPTSHCCDRQQICRHLQVMP